jgi:hypothetical protein
VNNNCKLAPIHKEYFAKIGKNSKIEILKSKNETDKAGKNANFTGWLNSSTTSFG